MYRMLAYRAEDISQRLVPHELYTREEFENSVQFDVSHAGNQRETVAILCMFVGGRTVHPQVDQEVCEACDHTAETQETHCEFSGLLAGWVTSNQMGG